MYKVKVCYGYYNDDDGICHIFKLLDPKTPFDDDIREEMADVLCTSADDEKFNWDNTSIEIPQTVIEQIKADGVKEYLADQKKETKALRLCDMVEVVANNSECVVLKVKDRQELNLICLGCFEGNETMLRLTKGGTQTCTVFTNKGTSYSWSWGFGGTTLVTDKMHKKGRMIQTCIENDFDINVTGMPRR